MYEIGGWKYETFKKVYPCTPDGSVHPKRRIRSPDETYSFTQRDVFFHLRRRIVQGTKTHPSSIRFTKIRHT